MRHRLGRSHRRATRHRPMVSGERCLKPGDGRRSYRHAISKLQDGIGSESLGVGVELVRDLDHFRLRITLDPLREGNASLDLSETGARTLNLGPILNLARRSQHRLRQPSRGASRLQPRCGLRRSLSLVISWLDWWFNRECRAGRARSLREHSCSACRRSCE
jgi:hypothetical protein